MPLSHPYLSEITNFMKQKGQRIEKYLLDEKQNVLGIENNAVLKNKNIVAQKYFTTKHNMSSRF